MIASTSLVVLSSLLTLGSAANIDVSVGATKAGTAGLVFDPPFTAAAVGDTVTFTFHPKNHTVTQSSFGNPCALLPANTTANPPTAAGIDTGYMPVAAGTTTLPTAVINVTTTAPLWFFCAQTGHCGQGMLFAINNATTGKTFDAYKANALANPTGAANGGTGTGGTQTTAGGATPSGSTTPAGSGAMSTFGLDKALSIAALVGLGLFTFA